ncbi:glutamate racemase [Clostridium sp. UBA6640]|uniref:glutamate racemase n=1 Tax=Clostridium sp. UBA6640 TaxID=1946370 RepID=UPI0025C37454|nr:glutamate racemase [Clostridium sp. UBA6640]
MDFNSENSIGFFDSGIGGLSVLKETIKVLPNENYIYFGDSINAPYGIKNVSEVKRLTFNAVKFLMSKNVKAIVIACNTATSAAIEELRRQYTNIPIIGIEPAVKPAVELNREGSIVIMATPMTLGENKFAKLQSKYKEIANIEPLPCAGLAEIIDEGKITGEEIHSYLVNKLKDIENMKISSIVLGCTHYPLIKEEIIKVIGNEIPVIDGSLGTSKQLKRMLSSRKILNTSNSKGNVQIYNSLQSKKIIDLSYKLLEV